VVIVGYTHLPEAITHWDVLFTPMHQRISLVFTTINPSTSVVIY